MHLCLFPFTARHPPSLCTLSLHDALPICPDAPIGSAATIDEPIDTAAPALREALTGWFGPTTRALSGPNHPVSASRSADRKSTRLNSSHVAIPYAVLCLKKKKRSTTSVTT